MIGALSSDAVKLMGSPNLRRMVFMNSDAGGGLSHMTGNKNVVVPDKPTGPRVARPDDRLRAIRDP